MSEQDPILSYQPDYTSLQEPDEIPFPSTRDSAVSLPSPGGGFRTPLTPYGKRAKSFSGFQDGMGQPLVASSVTNPASHDRRVSALLNLDQLYKRMETVRNMRSVNLIGKSPQLFAWSTCYYTDRQLKSIKNRKLVSFYRAQNEYIERYTAVDNLLDSGIHISMLEHYNTSNLDEEDEYARAPADIDLEGGKILGYNIENDGAIVDFAIKVNFAINVVLLLAKVVVVYYTRSMSIIASLVDSALDFLSTMVIFFSNKYASSQSTRFPIGRKRLEPLGVLVLSVIIILSFLQVLEEAVNRLFSEDTEVVELSALSTEIMGFTIAAKVICFIWCIQIPNSSVQALAEDARTDVVFNVFSILFPFVGVLLRWWWFDSVGAVVLCFYVVVQWCLIALEHINNLTGANASQQDYQEILYLIVRFSENISGVKNFRTYHVGDLLNVEVDIIIQNATLTMRDCHDLAESLQYTIETLPAVERAFVHIDYRVRNYKGHLN